MSLITKDNLFQKYFETSNLYHGLMKRRIRNILLAASYYDSFIMERDGRLFEDVYSEFRELDLLLSPSIKTVLYGDSLKKNLNKGQWDLLIINMNEYKDDLKEMLVQIKKLYPDLPVLMLINQKVYSKINMNFEDIDLYVKNMFLWNGDPRLFFAMIKSTEDSLNLANDVGSGLTNMILLAESSIQFYSNYLSLIYSELISQTKQLVAEESDEDNKHLMMRARPKLILVRDYEEAVKYWNLYSNNCIGVVTCSNLRKKGYNKADSGIKLIEEIRSKSLSVPIIMQSVDDYYSKFSEKLKYIYINKNTRNYILHFQTFIKEEFGLGDFVFRDSGGRVIRKVSRFIDFESTLDFISEESLIYHASNNHFSAWLSAHGELEIAREIQPTKVSDFTSVKNIRDFLKSKIAEARSRKDKGKIVDFQFSEAFSNDRIYLISEGSLGGKGRGLAFFCSLVNLLNFEKHYKNIRVKIPVTFVIGTDEFTFFTTEINYNEIVRKSDEEIRHVFEEMPLSDKVQLKLRHLIRVIKKPLAVRSSGLLEDSQAQPFAGIYQTYMIPNNHYDERVRFSQLASAVKQVFASPFLSQSRSYINSINYRIEEEKIAVVIQEIVGDEFIENLHFPMLSGVAQSYNFYPAFFKNSDGVVDLALGMGKAVVDGELTYKYIPEHPASPLEPPEEVVRNNQRNFYALDLSRKEYDAEADEDITIKKIRITSKHKEDVFKPFTSIWDHERLSFIDSAYAKGPRVFTFRNITHYRMQIVNEVIKEVLDLCESAVGVPVEIEFAVNIVPGSTEFYMLQMRPMIMHSEEVEIDLKSLDYDNVILISENSLGNGEISNIYDIVYVSADKFDVTKTLDIRMEIEQLNTRLKEEGRNYILIGPGRWGSHDRFLGVPVMWSNIDMAHVIVETATKEFQMEPSSGSHFMHNIAALNIGYFHTKLSDHFSREWLEKQLPSEVLNYCRLYTFKNPCIVKMNGLTNTAVIFKPE